MPENMKSVMTFTPEETDEETANNFINWLRDNNRLPDKFLLEEEKGTKNK